MRLKAVVEGMVEPNPLKAPEVEGQKSVIEQGRDEAQNDRSNLFLMQDHRIQCGGLVYLSLYIA